MFSLYRHLKAVSTSALVSLGLPPHSCRFTPSCSHYCEQALHTYGPIRGSLLCASRILRCNPLFKGGFDPLP